MIGVLEIISELPAEVKVFLLISLVATTGAVLFIAFLLSSRQVKNDIKFRETVFRDRFQTSLNVILLMDSSQNEPQASSQFYLSQLQRDMGDSRIAKQVMTDQLINLKKNIAGSSSDSLTNVYKKLGLNLFSQQKANSMWWSTKAQGIFELAQMDDKESFEKIKSNLSSRNETVREEAFMALVKLDKDNSLQFLNEYNASISPWMEMRIHQHLSNSDKRNLPDFSQWFNHQNLDVALFAIDMARQFRQLNSVKQLMQLLNDSNEMKIVLVIETLGDLEGHEAVTSLSNCVSKFWKNESISKRIARALGKIGYNENHWQVLAEYLKHPDYSVRFEAAQSLHKSGDRPKQVLKTANSDHTLNALVNHVEDPLLQL
jgi:HEAT repeat protein